jgi:hypothetical protein
VQPVSESESLAGSSAAAGRGDALDATRGLTGRRLTSAPIARTMFLATLALCLLYDAYRYPFRINSTLNPGYSNTPFALQAGKYVVLAAICVALVLWARHAPGLPDLLLLLAAAWIGARSLAAVAASHETQSFDVAAPFVFGAFVAVVLPPLRVGRIAYLAAAAAVVVHAVVNVIEINLLVFTGRLPGLSSPGDELKRFGGLWDDPNSVAVLSALVIVFLVARRRYTWWLIGVAAFNILVSISYSGVAALVVGLWVVLLWRRTKVALALVPVIAAAGVAVFVVPFEHVPGFGGWLAAKQDSALLRIQKSTLPAPDNWLLGGSVPHLSESSVAALVNTAGLIGLCLVLIWIVVSIREAPASNREWLIPLLVAFAVASQLVPYIGVFPLGTLFPIAVSLAARRPAAVDELEARAPPHVEGTWHEASA